MLAPCLVTMETVKSYFFLCLVSISCFLDNIYHMRLGHNLSPEAAKANSKLMAKTRDKNYRDRIYVPFLRDGARSETLCGQV